MIANYRSIGERKGQSPLKLEIAGEKLLGDRVMRKRIGLCALLLIPVTTPLIGRFRRNPREISQAEAAKDHSEERLLIAGSGSVQSYDPSTQTFKHVMNIVDSHPVLLTSGKVLFAEGDSFCLFDPNSTTCGQMFHNMIPFSTYSSFKLLLDDGRVLVMGGPPPDGERLAAVYDPVSNRFAVTGSMLEDLYGYAVTKLDDGRVLVTGGMGNGGEVGTKNAELYDPATGKFTSAGEMTASRYGNAATSLQDGRVLITGGDWSSENKSAEIYDPVKGIFYPTGQMNYAHHGHSATLLTNGMVLISGGADGIAELYNPKTGKFVVAGKMSEQREGPVGALLSNGEVLIAGGTAPIAGTKAQFARNKCFDSLGGAAISLLSSPCELKSAEVYDPITGTFTPLHGELADPVYFGATVISLR